jgi:hypothetical protein
MTMKWTIRGSLLALLAGLMVVSGGCGKTDPESKRDGETKTVAAKTKEGNQDTKHDAWWCEEHGIPEEECSMCSAKVAKSCKAKGDWCEKHDRALSQCFVCNPKRKEFYAAKYRAKFGKEPPPIEEKDEGGKKDDKK